MKDLFGTLCIIVGVLLCVVAPIAAWFTHVIHCLATAKYLLLIAGGFVFPIGISHGISIWFGMGW